MSWFDASDCEVHYRRVLDTGWRRAATTVDCAAIEETMDAKSSGNIRGNPR
jgi:hypothetical protein